MSTTPLAHILQKLESGGRPRGGVNGQSGEVLSVGAEHLSVDGTINLNAPKFISHEFYRRLRSGRIEPWDILIVKDGATTGKTVLVRDDLPYPEAAVNEHVFTLGVDRSRADPRYITFFLRSPAGQAEVLRDFRGATVGGISREFARTVLVPLPPLTEQRRIANILDHADDLRSQRRQALTLLGDMMRAAFIELFGDPISNPNRWPNPTLGKLLTFQQYGPRFYNEAYSSDGIRIIRITDLNEAGELDFAAMPRMAVTSEERDKYALRAGDLIFARTGATVGKVALIREGDPICIAGAYFITMRFDPAVEPVYVRAVLTSPSIRAVVAKQSRQAAQQNFSGPALRRLPMPVPPGELQRRFVGIANTVDKLRLSHHGSLAQLNALFSSLQHRAFQGEL